MKEININKYWIGYFTGIVICCNIFFAGVILGKTLSINWIVAFWIWITTLPYLFIIKYLYNKQKLR